MSGFERRLRAIAFVDVVDYSRRMGIDEEKTLDSLRQIDRSVCDLVAVSGGTLVKRIGDAWMISFESSVEAVRCVNAILDLALDGGLRLRAGIHAGDVVEQDNDLYGDAVNIAARLQGAAAPGGACLSRAVRDQ